MMPGPEVPEPSQALTPYSISSFELPGYVWHTLMLTDAASYGNRPPEDAIRPTLAYTASTESPYHTSFVGPGIRILPWLAQISISTPLTTMKGPNLEATMLLEIVAIGEHSIFCVDLVRSHGEVVPIDVYIRLSASLCIRALPLLLHDLFQHGSVTPAYLHERPSSSPPTLLMLCALAFPGV
jgi:hypothetical protein